MGTQPDLLVQIASRHAVYFEGSKTRYVDEFEKFLQAMQDDLEAQISAVRDPETFKGRRLNGLLSAIRKTLAGGFGDYETFWREQIEELAEYEAGFEVRSLSQVVKADFNLPSPSQLVTAAFARPLSVKGIDEGSLLASFYETWTAKSRRRVEGAIRMGFAQGETTNQILQRVRGTRRNKYKDGIVQTVRREVNMMVRTALQHVANSARESVWDANRDIVEQVEFLAVLDGRTSHLCRGLSGQRFDVGKGPIPPLHILCRSTLVPVLSDGLDFLDGAGQQFSRGEDGVKRVSADLTYYDWLKTQSAAFQDSVVGVSRGRLLRNGGITSKRFSELQLDKNFNPLTLEDMQRLEPLAFEKAFASS
jgi:SPP1 gp7 family putative phage head morphogenesis protein